MAAYDDCIREIQAAAGGKLSAEDLHDILAEILRRKNRSSSPGLGSADHVLRMAQEYGRSLEEAEEIARRNVLQDALKRKARRGVQAAAPDPGLGMEANLVGVNTPFAGNRDSVDAINRALAADWLAGLDIDLRKAGLDRYAAAGMDDQEVARELSELNKPDGKAGVTENDRAKRLAALLHKYQQSAFATLNRSGAWVKPFYGYVSRTIHDPDRVRGLGKWDLLSGRMPEAERAREVWAQTVLNEADLDKSWGGRDNALKALPQLWAEFTSGKHLAGIDPDEVQPPKAFGPNQGRRASSSREIIWKSADAWARYNARYGAGTTVAAVASSLQRSARISALLQKFGTNPSAAFESDLLHWQKETITDERAGRALEKAIPKLRNQLAVVDSSADIPANVVSAARLTAWLRYQRWTKLGSAPLAAVGDLATKMGELRYQGVPFFDRVSGLLTDYLGRAGMSADQRAAADLLKAGVDGEIHALASRFEVGTSKPGLGTTIDNIFFKYTGLTPMTDHQRLGAQMIMARNLGRLKGRSLTELPRGLPGLLRGTGIDPDTWNLLRSADWKVVGKRDFFEPSIVDRIDPRKLVAYGGGRDLEDVKADLRQKVLQFIHDRGVYAVIEPTARTRATMYGATRPGTLDGNALRLLLQFKSFSAAMIEKTWGREIYGGVTGADRAAGIAELMLSSALFGYLSMSLRDALYGKTPRDPRDPQTMAAAISAGGGLSIYGDFLFGSWSRYGQSMGDSLLGPTFGQVSSAADLFSSLRNGQDSAAQAFQMVKQNVPFLNIWAARTLLNHLIFDRIQDYLSPGYLQRQESKVTDQANAPWLLRVRQDWWLPPTSALQ